jgi:hypothetical protein
MTTKRERRLTNKQAAEMLRKLRLHFNEPVMPVSRYCEALETWARVVEENGYATKAEGVHLHTTILRIQKSNLLARLIYGGEKLRKRKCPEHHGHWSGIEFEDTACPYGCGLTGWLPEPVDNVSDT